MQENVKTPSDYIKSYWLINELFRSKEINLFISMASSVADSPRWIPFSMASSVADSPRWIPFSIPRLFFHMLLSYHLYNIYCWKYTTKLNRQTWIHRIEELLDKSNIDDIVGWIFPAYLYKIPFFSAIFTECWILPPKCDYLNIFTTNCKVRSPRLGTWI